MQEIHNAILVRKTASTAWFDVDGKFESAVPISEWGDCACPSIGETQMLLVDFDIRSIDGVYSATLLSVHIDPVMDWQQIIEPFSVGQVVTGVVTRRIKSGYLADIGLPIFLHDEQFGQIQQLGEIVGAEVSVEISLIDYDNRRVEGTLVQAAPDNNALDRSR